MELENANQQEQYLLYEGTLQTAAFPAAQATQGAPIAPLRCWCQVMAFTHIPLAGALADSWLPAVHLAGKGVGEWGCCRC